MQSDGKIVLAGAFTSLRPNNAALGTARGHIARINADGSLDNSFNPTLDGQVSAMVLQSDGKFVLGGLFVAVTLLLPRGIVGSARYLMERWRAHKAAGAQGPATAAPASKPPVPEPAPRPAE